MSLPLKMAVLAAALSTAPLFGAGAAPAQVMLPVTAAGLPVETVQYYYGPPRRRCWTTSARRVWYDRWGRPHVRWVPRTVCGYRRY